MSNQIKIAHSKVAKFDFVLGDGLRNELNLQVTNNFACVQPSDKMPFLAVEAEMMLVADGVDPRDFGAHLVMNYLIDVDGERDISEKELRGTYFVGVIPNALNKLNQYLAVANLPALSLQGISGHNVPEKSE